MTDYNSRAYKLFGTFSVNTNGSGMIVMSTGMFCSVNSCLSPLKNPAGNSCNE